MKVSIIIPVYNVERYIRRCLDSVCNQTYSDIEIIIVNDGSTDGCTQICHEYAEKNEKILLVEKENGGLVSAWQEGLEYITGDYICFIDSDDYISVDYIETLVYALEPDIEMVSMNCTQTFDNGQTRAFKINSLPAGTYAVDDEFKSVVLNDKGAYFRTVAVSRWGKIIKADLVKEYSKYCTQKISFGEDQQLTVGIMTACKKIKIIDEYKYFYQYNTTSILNSYKKDLWPKILLLMDTLYSVPGLKNLPDAERQFNTQYLLYCTEYIRNEFYHKKLRKEDFYRVINDSHITNALDNYYCEKMRFLDTKMTEYIISKSYLKIKVLLIAYYLKSKLKGIPL